VKSTLPWHPRLRVYLDDGVPSLLLAPATLTAARSLSAMKRTGPATSVANSCSQMESITTVTLGKTRLTLEMVAPAKGMPLAWASSADSARLATMRASVRRTIHCAVCVFLSEGSLLGNPGLVLNIAHRGFKVLDQCAGRRQVFPWLFQLAIDARLVPCEHGGSDAHFRAKDPSANIASGLHPAPDDAAPC
jgi:hypothetical protein